MESPGIERLEFDSGIFGFEMGRAMPERLGSGNLTLAMKDWKDRGFRMVVLDLPLDARGLEKELASLGKKPVTGRVEYGGGIPALREPSGTAVRLRSVERREAGPEWVEIACQAGGWSRYRRDPRIPEDVFREVYRRWMDNSIGGKAADSVWGAWIGEKPVGAVTAKRGEKAASIGLLAVLEGYRGRGIGRGLMNESFRWMLEEGFGSWVVVTQTENEEACRFYASLGARPLKRYSTYHLWL